MDPAPIPTAIERLAERCGIVQRTEDARGKEVVTKHGTNIALLSAMGIEGADEACAERALTALETEEWARPLPHVVVAYADGSFSGIPVCLPLGTDSFRWYLSLEDGSQREGEAQFGQLELLARQNGDSSTKEKRLLRLPDDIPLGYHRFRLDTQGAELSLIVSSGKCWLPPLATESRRLWGIAAQLYLLRSERNWGIGDFTDLRRLMEMSQAQGADAVGVNPLHAMFPDRPDEASPYSPSDRNLLNTLYIDVEAVPGFLISAGVQELWGSEEFQSRLVQLREEKEVNYPDVAAVKIPVLKMLFEDFVQRGDGRERDRFQGFLRERGSLMQRACTYQALRAFLAEQQDPAGDESDWPTEFETYDAPGVAKWADEHRDDIDFQCWMQWTADEQLKRATSAASAMELGLYRDMAVGSSPSGAEMWCHSKALLRDVHVGAPSDIFNPAGQDWGLPPFHPRRLQEEEYRPFIELLRANMRHCGALRIDHAMALQRLYWIPWTHEGVEGAFVRYPLEDLVGILALESQRNECLVIGEDLGTVPACFRERMTQANILSYRVLLFERNDEGFLSPEQYPAMSLSVASSHDLPTLRGWLQGADLDAKERLKLFPSAETCSDARKTRATDRRDLLSRLAGGGNSANVAEDATFRDAVHAFLAQTSSMLTLVQLDDMTGELEQVNIPGTTEAPNWRRKYGLTLDELAGSRAWQNTAKMMCEQRGRGPVEDIMEASFEPAEI